MDAILKKEQAQKSLRDVHEVRIGSARDAELLHDSRKPIVKHDELVALQFFDAAKKTLGALVQWNCHPEAVHRNNTELTADRKVITRVLARDEALALPDIIRTQSNLIPAEEQEIRIVDIVGLDVQADGGTHVASTSQVGRITVAKVESKGKANRRVRVRVED